MAVKLTHAARRQLNARRRGAPGITVRNPETVERGGQARIPAEIEALRQNVVSLRREFSEAVAGIVSGQVAAQVEAHRAALEQSMHARIVIAVEAMMEPRLRSLGAALPAAVESAVQKAVGSAVPAAIESRVPAALSAGLAPLEMRIRAEVEQTDREIAELRQRLADADAKVMALILGLGQLCRQAAEKIVPGAVPEIPAGSGEAAGTTAEGTPESHTPGDAPGQEPNRLRIVR